MIIQNKINGTVQDIASVGLSMTNIGSCRLCGQRADYRIDIIGIEPLGVCDQCLHKGGNLYSIYAVIYKYFQIPKEFQRKPY